MRFIAASLAGQVLNLTKRQPSGYKPDPQGRKTRAIAQQRCSAIFPNRAVRAEEERSGKIALRRLAAIFLVLCFLCLAGCGEPDPEAGVTPAAEVALVDQEALTPAAVGAGFQPAQGFQPAPTPTAGREDVDECLRCHADKERLVDTASPEEEVISENEGEG